MRTFYLRRREDVTGVSGVGDVAEGCQWRDGTVTVRWYGEHPSTVNWSSIEDAMAIHGHDGRTVVAWTDC